MKLCDVFTIMEKYLDDLVIPIESTKTNVDRAYTFLNAFLDDADDDSNPIYLKDPDYIRKFIEEQKRFLLIAQNSIMLICLLLRLRILFPI